MIPKDKGMYLVYPHCPMIYNKEKTLIIKKRPFWKKVKKIHLLIGPDEDRKQYAWGYIEIFKIRKITIEEFGKLEKQHLITEKERKKWWGKCEELYAYYFNFIPFDELKEVEVKQGTQTFIKEVKFC